MEIKELFTNYQDKNDGLIVETHYYKWLEKNIGYNHFNYLKTKVNYLESIGFNLSKNRLPNEYLENLKYIEQHYTYNILNMLNNIIHI